jgi:hypothetical protein
MGLNKAREAHCTHKNMFSKSHILGLNILQLGIESQKSHIRVRGNSLHSVFTGYNSGKFRSLHPRSRSDNQSNELDDKPFTAQDQYSTSQKQESEL